ncbi:MAG: glycosyltransferase family 2 protein [Candidatus Paceibacterota bacterium]|jgi:glycosyltransferase involved in cell wall biosynthesis
MKTLSIIIPCFNEQATIHELLQRVLQVSLPSNWKKEIVVVDDGSQDDTRKILDDYKDRLKIIYHTKNQGKGSAVKTGIENSSGDYILIQDADLEYNPKEIPLLINELNKGKADIIYGSRNIHHEKRKGMYIPRVGVWFITKQFNILYGSKLTDLWTCYKLFPKKAGHLFVSGRFESELIFSTSLVKNNFKIAEVPISHNPRTIENGKKIKYRDGIIGIWVLFIQRFK